MRNTTITVRLSLSGQPEEGTLVSDERKHQVISLWIWLTVDEFNSWLEEQPDKEELQLLIEQLLQFLQKRDRSP